MTNQVGQYLRQRREAKQLSQAELGQILGYGKTSQYVSAVELGKNKLPMEKAIIWMRSVDASPTKIKKMLVKNYSDFLDENLGLR